MPATDETYPVTDEQLRRIRDNLDAIHKVADTDDIRELAVFTRNILDEIVSGDGGDV
jgi:hypothetical protein